jgi:DNA-binding HxlR family transcriptional regulator
MYQPKLKDEVIRRLYREARRRKEHMTTLLNKMVSTALAELEQQELCSREHHKTPVKEKGDAA